MKIFTSLLLMVSILTLSACNKNTPEQHKEATKETISQENNHQDFIGCYTINFHSPAQIKISEQDNKLVMHMKEPKGAKEIWDKPEPLQTIDNNQAWEYFKVNTLDLNKTDVQSAITRPDKLMTLLKIKEASKNINPKLDSDYVVYIFQGANTIYKVECDDTQVDIVK